MGVKTELGKPLNSGNVLELMLEGRVNFKAVDKTVKRVLNRGVREKLKEEPKNMKDGIEGGATLPGGERGMFLVIMSPKRELHHHLQCWAVIHFPFTKTKKVVL